MPSALGLVYLLLVMVYHIIPSGEWKGQEEADQENKKSAGSSPHWFPLKTFQALNKILFLRF